MSYRIEQDYKYRGRDRWQWSVWIEADGSSLDDLDEVVWILHPSFTQPRISRKNAGEKFKLEASGWGTFLVRAELKATNGNTIEISHHLVLEYPEEASTPTVRSLRAISKGNVPRVFLSYSAADKLMAEEVKNQLLSFGTQVLDASQIEPGMSLSSGLEGMIRQSDAVIGIVGPDEASPFVVREIQQARESGKPVLRVVHGANSNPGIKLDQQDLRMQFAPGKADSIGGLVQDWLKRS